MNTDQWTLCLHKCKKNEVEMTNSELITRNQNTLGTIFITWTKKAVQNLNWNKSYSPVENKNKQKVNYRISNVNPTAMW